MIKVLYNKEGLNVMNWKTNLQFVKVSKLEFVLYNLVSKLQLFTHLLYRVHTILFLRWPFWKGREIAAILLVASREARQRGFQLYLHLLESFKWLPSVNKHSAKSLMDTCRL